MSSLSRNEYIGIAIAVLVGIAIFAFGLLSMGTEEQTGTVTNNTAYSFDMDTNSGATMDNGLRIEDLVVGEGDEAVSGKAVFMEYTGMLEDGTVFDSSKNAGQPFGFVLGQGYVIAGWEQGVPGMKVGGERRLVIPADLAYGADGVKAPDGTVVIPGNATLIFDVKLVAVQALE